LHFTSSFSLPACTVLVNHLSLTVTDAPDDSSAAIPLQPPENHISATNIQTQNNKL